MIGLEQVLTGDGIERNFNKLKSLVIDTGGVSLSIRTGTHTASFVAAANSGAETITHGLGTTPELFVVFPTFGATVAMIANYVAASRNDTTIQYRLDTRDGSVVTENVNVFWVVAG